MVRHAFPRGALHQIQVVDFLDAANGKFSRAVIS